MREVSRFTFEVLRFTFEVLRFTFEVLRFTFEVNSLRSFTLLRLGKEIELSLLSLCATVYVLRLRGRLFCWGGGEDLFGADGEDGDTAGGDHLLSEGAHDEVL